VIAAAPADAIRVAGNLRAGLVNAFGEVGRSVLGDGFRAVLTNPPEPVRTAPRSSEDPGAVIDWLLNEGRQRH